MKKYFFYFSLIIFFFCFGLFIFQTGVHAASIAENVKGRILLQVQQKGEAWYVSPDTLLRHYMGRPTDAFELMRSQGLGISTEDIMTIPVGYQYLSGIDTDGDGLSDIFEDAVGTYKDRVDSDYDGYSDAEEIKSGYHPLLPLKKGWPIGSPLAKRLKGKILLQVEQRGEAWYMNPTDGKRYFLGRPADAFTIMRNLGLGITDEDLAKIGRDDQPESSSVFTNSIYGYKLDFFDSGYEGISNTFNTSAAEAADASIRKSDEPLDEYQGFTFRPSLDIKVRSNSVDKTVLQVAQENFTLNQNAGYTKSDISDVVLGGVSGKQFDVAGGLMDSDGSRMVGEVSVIYLVKNNYIYQLVVPSNHLVLNKIMNSFEFSSVTSDWLAYRNDEFGFEVGYPDYYQTLRTTDLLERDKDIYNDSGTIRYSSKVLAILSLTTNSLEANSYPTFNINVFALDSYRFNDWPGGYEYGYDTAQGEWWENPVAAGRTSANLKIINADTASGYELSTGDAGHSFSAVAIPVKDKNLMIEFSFASDPLTKKDAPIESILSTFRFLD